MDPPGVAAAALGISNHPAHRVARGYGSRADQLLTWLQSNVRDLCRRRIDLIERAWAIWKHLNRVEIPRLPRLNAGRVVGTFDPLCWSLCFLLLATARRRPN